MASEPATIYLKLQQRDGWELEEKTTYNAQKLADEYREQLYSEKAKKLFLNKAKEDSPTE